MAPDFEYYARLTPAGHFGHSPAGLLLLDLPLGILVLWLFHAYAKQPLWSWLPERTRVRIALGPPRLPASNARQFALLCLSIVVGAATHIVWDSFTHHRYWPYYHLAFLRHVLVLPILGRSPVYNLLQHVSTVVGILVLALWWMQWLRNTPPISLRAERRGSRRRALLAILAIAFAAALIRAWIGAGIPSNRRTAAIFIVEAVISGTTILWVEVVAYGALVAKREDKQG
jgi:hypothetical protein